MNWTGEGIHQVYPLESLRGEWWQPTREPPSPYRKRTYHVKYQCSLLCFRLFATFSLITQLFCLPRDSWHWRESLLLYLSRWSKVLIWMGYSTVTVTLLAAANIVRRHALMKYSRETETLLMKTMKRLEDNKVLYCALNTECGQMLKISGFSSSHLLKLSWMEHKENWRKTHIITGKVFWW